MDRQVSKNGTTGEPAQPEDSYTLLEKDRLREAPSNPAPKPAREKNNVLPHTTGESGTAMNKVQTSPHRREEEADDTLTLQIGTLPQ